MIHPHCVYANSRVGNRRAQSTNRSHTLTPSSSLFSSSNNIFHIDQQPAYIYIYMHATLASHPYLQLIGALLLRLGALLAHHLAVVVLPAVVHKDISVLDHKRGELSAVLLVVVAVAVGAGAYL